MSFCRRLIIPLAHFEPPSAAMFKAAQHAVRQNAAVRALKAFARAPSALRALLRENIYRHNAPHELAVCAIFKDEAGFLREWIRFHQAVGVTQFYLYDNNSADH